MLRPAVKLAPDAEPTAWRVSAGSATVLGLARVPLGAAPTTAYLLLGERCARNCAFCTQARTSASGDDLLSRVSWPRFDGHDVAERIAAAHAAGVLQRACFQVTVCADYIEMAAQEVAALSAHSAVPICASVAARDLGDYAHLLEAGAERVTLALDAATPALYAQIKGGSFERAWELLAAAAVRYPGRVGTHLIAGLGETERELVECLARLHALGVATALFAFTPVAGTALAERPAPSLATYRRVQAAHWLLLQGLANPAALAYDAFGHLRGYGADPEQVAAWLGDGEAFRTSGCPGCNRPYYNERPGGVMYNYPRPLTPDEARAAVALALREENRQD